MRAHGGSRAQRRLTLLAVFLLAGGAALFMRLPNLPGPTHPLRLPVLALATVLVLAELSRMHIEIRGSAITITPSDAALIVGLFTLPPADVVLLRIAVGIPVLVLLYRRSPIRIAVNTGTMLVEAAACASVLSYAAADGPTSPRAWIIALLAVQVSGVLAGLIVNLAIRFNGDSETFREVVAGLVLGANVSGVSGLVGVICVALTSVGSAGRWLVLAAVVAAFVVYRNYARLLERKAALEAVHRFSRSLDTDAGADALVAAVLSGVPGLVGAARAELVLRRDDGSYARAFLVDDGVHVEAVSEFDGPVRQVLDTGQPLALGRHSRQRSVRQLLQSAAMRELMVAPLPTELGASGVLMAVDRVGQARGFRRADLMLFETLALNAGVAMQNVELVDQLRHDVAHDRLTALLNRQGLSDALAGRHSAGLVLIQLNSLREVNDALGHAAGDALLVAAAERIRGSVRAGTPVARLEHDVFAVLLTKSEVSDVEAVGDRLLALFAEPVEIDEIPVPLGATLGMASGVGGDELVRHAELALRAAGGRDGNVRVYEAGMEPPSARRLSIAAELRQVLASPERSRDVVVFYQPKADLRSGRVHAVEALVRWTHPERGLVLPGDFIPVVESTGLVRPLTLHVLDLAMADAVRWQADGLDLSVAVNLSAQSLHDPRLLDDVMSVLQKHGAAPELLTLEITESAVMDDPDRARDTLEELAALGVKISVDDFGTGYSSLAYLARLPVNEVKVDRMFVSRMISDARDAAVVRSVVELGHSLGLRVVAEGVEEQECWQALQEMGVDIAQGFLLSRPIAVEQFEAWFAEYDDQCGYVTEVAQA